MLRQKHRTLMTRMVFRWWAGFLVSLIALSAPAKSFAASCTNIPNLTYHFAGLPSTRPAVTLAAGDVVTFTVTKNFGDASVATIKLGATVVGTVAPTGIITFTAATAGNFIFSYSIAITPPGITTDVTFTATCAAGAPPAAGGDKAAATDASVRAGDAGRLTTEAGAFPIVPENTSLTVGELRARIRRNQDALKKVEARLEKFRKEEDQRSNGGASGSGTSQGSVLPPSSGAPDWDLQRNLERRATLLRNQLSHDGDELALKGDLPDADTALRAAFEPTTLTTLRPTFSTQSVQRVGPDTAIWSRLKYSQIDGSFDRSGQSIHGQFGYVRRLSDGVHAGAFASLLYSEIDSTALGTDLETVGIGGGAYMRLDLGNRVEGGLSATYERSDNDIVVGGAGGNFNRDLYTLDASLTRSYDAGPWVLRPTAVLSYRYSNRHAYVDSTATLIPANRESQTVASGVLGFRRYLATSPAWANLVSIDGSLAADYAMHRLDSLAFAAGSVLTENRLSGRADAELRYEVIGSGAVFFGLSAAGLGGETRAYSGRVGFKRTF